MFFIGCLFLPVIGGIELVRFAGARTASDEGRIVFAREEQGIWVMDADGKNEKQLTAVKYDRAPAWSPDGRLIAFANQGIRICIMNADGTNVKQVTNSNRFDASDDDPTWSPDGKQISFSRTIFERMVEQVEAKSSDIYVMDADGSNVKSLTEGPLLFLAPDWSPDGKKIAFEEPDRQGARASHVWVMDADGSNVQRLANTPANERWLDWTAFSYGVEPAGKLETTWGKIKQKLSGK